MPVAHRTALVGVGKRPVKRGDQPLSSCCPGPIDELTSSGPMQQT